MIKTKSLVGAWEMEGNFLDSSGNGNNGTFTTNVPVLATGKRGQCYNWAGSLDRQVFVPYVSALDSAYITISFWFKLNASYADQQAIVGRGKDNSWCITVVANSTTSLSYRFYINGSAVNVTVNFTDLTVWNHIAVTYNGSNIITYKNGVLLNTTAAAGTISAYPSMNLGFGIFDDRRLYILNGQIDSVQLYNSALLLSDIKRIMIGLHPING